MAQHERAAQRITRDSRRYYSRKDLPELIRLFAAMGVRYLELHRIIQEKSGQSLLDPETVDQISSLTPLVTFQQSSESEPVS